MTSHPRPQRPAATDYFNPTKQTELLQSIKAKIELSATNTPAELQFQNDVVGAFNGHPSKMAPYGGLGTTDIKAHELSLREKLERAKADREAKAKAEAEEKTAVYLKIN